MISSSLFLMFYSCTKLSDVSEPKIQLSHSSVSLSLSYFREAVTSSAYKKIATELNDTMEYSDFCTPTVSISGNG